MDEEQKAKPPPMSGDRITRFVFGVILFGILMGIRGEFHSIWVRVLVGACAGAVLGIFVLPFKRRKD